MKRREDDCKAGTMCTCRAARGRLGRSSLASWVVYKVVPLGLAMPRGQVVTRLLANDGGGDHAEMGDTTRISEDII